MFYLYLYGLLWVPIGRYGSLLGPSGPPVSHIEPHGDMMTCSWDDDDDEDNDDNDDDGDEGDDMAAAANIWVKRWASWQIGVKTESKSNDARLVTVTLVTRYITRQIENIERIKL